MAEEKVISVVTHTAIVAKVLTNALFPDLMSATSLDLPQVPSDFTQQMDRKSTEITTIVDFQCSFRQDLV